jgi:hypothetical protein
MVNLTAFLDCGGCVSFTSVLLCNTRAEALDFQAVNAADGLPPYVAFWPERD